MAEDRDKKEGVLHSAKGLEALEGLFHDAVSGDYEEAGSFEDNIGATAEQVHRMHDSGPKPASLRAIGTINFQDDTTETVAPVNKKKRKRRKSQPEEVRGTAEETEIEAQPPAALRDTTYPLAVRETANLATTRPNWIPGKENAFPVIPKNESQALANISTEGISSMGHISQDITSLRNPNSTNSTTGLGGILLWLQKINDTLDDISEKLDSLTGKDGKTPSPLAPGGKKDKDEKEDGPNWLGAIGGVTAALAALAAIAGPAVQGAISQLGKSLSSAGEEIEAWAKKLGGGVINEGENLIDDVARGAKGIGGFVKGALTKGEGLLGSLTGGAIKNVGNAAKNIGRFGILGDVGVRLGDAWYQHAHGNDKEALHQVGISATDAGEYAAMGEAILPKAVRVPAALAAVGTRYMMEKKKIEENEKDPTKRAQEIADLQRREAIDAGIDVGTGVLGTVAALPVAAASLGIAGQNIRLNHSLHGDQKRIDETKYLEGQTDLGADPGGNMYVRNLPDFKKFATEQEEKRKANLHGMPDMSHIDKYGKDMQGAFIDSLAKNPKELDSIFKEVQTLQKNHASPMEQFKAAAMANGSAGNAGGKSTTVNVTINNTNPNYQNYATQQQIQAAMKEQMTSISKQLFNEESYSTGANFGNTFDRVGATMFTPASTP